MSASEPDVAIEEARLTGVLEEGAFEPGDETALKRNLALLRYNLWRAQTSLEALERFVTVAEPLLEDLPDDAELYEALAFAYFIHGDRNRARRFVDTGMAKAGRALHFQPGATVARPAQVLENVAAHRRRQWGEETARQRYTPGAIATWEPHIGQDGRVILLGAAAAGAGDVTFRLRPLDGEETRDRDDLIPAAFLGGDPQTTDAVRHVATEPLSLPAGTGCRFRLEGQAGGGRDHGGWKTLRLPGTDAARAGTMEGSVERDGFVILRGCVSGATVPSAYWFEAGTDPEALNWRTPTQPVPPAKTLEIRDLFATPRNPAGFHAFEGWIEAVPERAAPRTDSEAPPFPLFLLGPFGKDRNHVRGIGAIDLIAGWGVGENPDDRAPGGRPGSTLDLRDADITVEFRADGLDQPGAALTFVVQSEFVDQASGELRHANWALTGQAIPLAEVSDQGWRRLRFHLGESATQWTFMADNEAEIPTSSQYAYAPIGHALGHHRGNVYLCLVGGDERRLCEGTIGLGAISLTARNHSLLAPGGPTALVSWPAGGLSDPANLTSGRRGDPAYFWRSGPDPQAPPEFVWDLGAERPLETFRAYQDDVLPTRVIEVSLSGDGRNFDTAFTGEIARSDPKAERAPVLFRIAGQPITARFLRLRLLEAYQPGFFGLDAFEVFGPDDRPAPGPEPTTLSEEVGLSGDADVYFRIVAENRYGTAAGEIQHIVPRPD